MAAETQRFQRWMAEFFEPASHDSSRARFLIVGIAPPGSAVSVALFDLHERQVFFKGACHPLLDFFFSTHLKSSHVLYVLVPRNQNLDPATKMRTTPSPTSGHFAFGVAGIPFEPSFTNFKAWTYFYGLNTNRAALAWIRANT